MNRLFLAAVVACAAFFTGCASIVDGKLQTVNFSSNPDGATVVFNGLPVGKTPVTVPLQRVSGPVVLRFSKEGYKDSEIVVNAALNKWFWGNIISGGLYGSTTDYLTGAMHEYQPGNFMVTLTPIDAAALQGGMSLGEKQKVVNFIVVSYGSLVVELTGKSGQYLSSLFAISSVPTAEQDELRKKLRALVEVYPVIPEFANAAADILLKR